MVRYSIMFGLFSVFLFFSGAGGEQRGNAGLGLKRRPCVPPVGI